MPKTEANNAYDDSGKFLPHEGEGRTIILVYNTQNFIIQSLNSRKPLSRNNYIKYLDLTTVFCVLISASAT